MSGGDDPLVLFEGASVVDSARRYLYSDERGAITAITDSTGAVMSGGINSYDEYGIPGSTNSGRFQYTGQAWLPELGLYYYKARMYSPTLGRFMQTDPIGYGDGMNMYAYVHGDPVNSIDPSGLLGVYQCSVDMTFSGSPEHPYTTMTSNLSGCSGSGVSASAGIVSGVPFSYAVPPCIDCVLVSKVLADAQNAAFGKRRKDGALAQARKNKDQCPNDKSIKSTMKEAARRGDNLGGVETFFWVGRATPNGPLKIGAIRTINSPTEASPGVLEAIFRDGIVFDKTFYHYHPNGTGLSGSQDDYFGDIGAANGGFHGLGPEFNIASFNKSGEITGCYTH